MHHGVIMADQLQARPHKVKKENRLTNRNQRMASRKFSSRRTGAFWIVRVALRRSWGWLEDRQFLGVWPIDKGWPIMKPNWITKVGKWRKGHAKDLSTICCSKGIQCLVRYFLSTTIFLFLQTTKKSKYGIGILSNAANSAYPHHSSNPGFCIACRYILNGLICFPVEFSQTSFSLWPIVNGFEIIGQFWAHFSRLQNHICAFWFVPANQVLEWKFT